MNAVLLGHDDMASKQLVRADLTNGFPENWLQGIVFDNPTLLPLDKIDRGSGPMIPLCRELTIPKAGGSVFLDILGVTPQGRLVLVECKLWRNPQARREVVAQIIEYAALLRRWSYADLTARLKARYSWKGQNPIFERVVAAGDCLGEADFCDAVARSLRMGDFDLIVAGDGIREDMGAIAEHLQGQGARLALVEFQIWEDAAGVRLVVPQIPFRTEVHKQKIIVDHEGSPLNLAKDEGDDELEATVDPDRAERQSALRQFWQCYIDEVEFDHADQPKPRHGGVNWVKVPLPCDSRLTAYRTKQFVGFFLKAPDESGAYDALAKDEEAIREEIALPELRFHRINAPELRDTIGIDCQLADLSDEKAQLSWLKDVGNRLVNSLRPRLAAFEDT